MGNQGRIRLVVLTLIALCLMGWLVLREAPEPVYQGRPLSAWLNDYDTHRNDPNGVAAHDADAAIRHIGTNAIPTLLRMLRRRDSQLTSAVMLALVQRQHFYKVNYVFEEERFSDAERGFMQLGPMASNAVPALMDIWQRNYSPLSHACVLASFMAIGSAAKPALPLVLEDTTNSESWVRGDAIAALGGIHPRFEIIMPALMRAMSDSDAQVRSTVPYALISYETNAAPLLPEARKLLQDPDPGVRHAASNLFEEVKREENREKR